MLPPRVVSHLPLRVDDRSLPNLDDTVARAEANGARGLDEIDMGPQVAVIVNVIGDLAQQDALGFQHAVCFLDERRVSVSERVALFLRGSKAQAESRVEVLGPVSSLVGDVRRVVNDRVEENGAERILVLSPTTAAGGPVRYPCR